MSAKIYVGSVLCSVFSYSTVPRLSCFEIQTDCGFRSVDCSNLSWNTNDDTLNQVSDLSALRLRRIPPLVVFISRFSAGFLCLWAGFGCTRFVLLCGLSP